MSLYMMGYTKNTVNIVLSLLFDDENIFNTSRKSEKFTEIRNSALNRRELCHTRVAFSNTFGSVILCIHNNYSENGRRSSIYFVCLRSEGSLTKEKFFSES